MRPTFFTAVFKNLWLWFPLCVVMIAGYFSIQPLAYYGKEVIGFTLMTLAATSITSLFYRTALAKGIAIASYILLAFFAFVKLSFYLQYGVGISASALFVIFETNAGEASDYLSNYFNTTTIFLAILLLAPLFWLLNAKRKRKIERTPNKIQTIFRAALLIGIAFISVFLIRKYFRTQNIPYATISTFKEYKIAKQQLKDKLAQPTSPAFTEVTSQADPQTYVVVIGESTSSWHLQLYGYGRETNPNLTTIKNDLLVMDNVISPHVHTITAVEKILTLADSENSKPSVNGSIIQLANQAGFTTYWISNQKPVGLYESIPTILGSAAKHTRFLATDDYNYQIYDEAVLPVLDELLQEETHVKKIIFIHLIGTHLRYEKRYPETFNVFKDNPPHLKFQHQKAIEQTNLYDNAVRYNDSIMYEIIQRLDQQTERSYMAYFADHGDEVYDTMDFLGHNEYHGTAPMFEVPMIFWFSEAYKKPSDSLWATYNKRKYSLEHFPHTFAQLSGIGFKGFDASKSILDSSFVDRPRIVKDTVDYDKR
tara:strand:+ start:47124 stop:48737 length:1614 start_codon:yes stop_codon:yes gene_type:complete